jgi:hypothetical protein
MYSWVVISSHHGWLENLLFNTLYTSFGVWHRDYYMLLQRFTMGCIPGLAKAVHSTIAMLRFPGVVHRTMAPLAPFGPEQMCPSCTIWAWANDRATSHSSEQDTLPTTSLISKQVIPYRIHGGTCCHGLSTLKTRYLANSSKTNHKPWRSKPSPPFQSLLKPQHQTSPRSLHNTMDGRPTLSTLNRSQTQYYEDGKTCTMTQDCRAKHN